MPERDRPSSEQRGTRARLHEAWESTLGRFATAEDGSRTLVDRLVGWGKLTADDGRALLQDWRSAIEDNRRQLEQRVDAAVHSSLARFRLPSKRQLQALDNKVADLEERLRQLPGTRSS